MPKNDRTLESALDYLSREARTQALDAIYCQLHNRANDLAGNTEQNDLDWFASRLWAETDFNRSWGRWSEVDTETRERYLNLAHASLVALVALMGRIESRTRTYAATLHDLLKADWAEKGEERYRRAPSLDDGGRE